MRDSSKKMPVLFIGHGSPMNAIEDNVFTENWKKIAEQIPEPEAILCISAHWYTHGTKVTTSEAPRMIYDMYGFPEELYQIKYPAKGTPELADYVKSIVKKEVTSDSSWGYDHGAWSVLCRMYPKANIPMIQLSIDMDAPAEVHYQIGQDLESLREKGVLIIGSGNVVHNLMRINMDMKGGFPWAQDFDQYIKDKILLGQKEDVINYRNAGKSSDMAFYTPEHFYPLLYALGASQESEVFVFNDECVYGSLSMTCYMFT